MRKICVRVMFLFSVAIALPSAIFAMDKPELLKNLSTRFVALQKNVNAQENKPKADNKPSTQDADGSVLLHSKTASVHGVKLQYEPQVNKNTLG
ncbi:MAG: hypothetical protein WCN64_14500, partial [Planctomycetota bacterium]